MTRQPILLLAFLLLPYVVEAQPTLVRSVVGSGATNAAAGNFSLRGTVGQAVTGPVAGVSFTNGQGFWYVIGSGGTPSFVLLNLKLWLEGPFNGMDMNTDLNPAQLEAHALQQPYGGAPWNCTGACDAAVAAGFFNGQPNVVDWLYLQLRSGSPTSPPMNVVAEAVGFVKSDGTVVALDGASPVSFSSTGTGMYYVVADHRNHLAVMSSGLVDFSTGTGTHDFTLAGSAYGTTPMVDLTGSGPFGLFAGDADGDGNVFNNDMIAYWLVQVGASSYQGADFDLDGNVFNNDLINYWLLNAGRSTAVPAP